MSRRIREGHLLSRHCSSQPSIAQEACVQLQHAIQLAIFQSIDIPRQQFARSEFPL